MRGSQLLCLYVVMFAVGLPTLLDFVEANKRCEMDVAEEARPRCWM